MVEMIKAWYAAEKEKMEEMTKEQKINYVVEYYLVFIIGAVLLLIAVIWFIFHFAFGNKEQGFNCALVNCAVEGNSIELSDGLTEFFGYNPKKKEAYFDPGYQIAYPGVDNEAADNSFYEKFFLNIRVGVLDAAIMPQSFMEYCNTVGHPFYDVYDVLSEEQIKTYEPCFLKGKDEDEKEYTCGIDISKLKFFDKMGIYEVEANEGEPLVLTFTYGGMNLEESRRFLDYLETFEE
ncbi:MAG: hypothetical protein K2L07_01695 [Lachnospiraceae bacterium]|nr:hypothetical protein [Lachnospiraceae bacterium]